VLSFRLVPIPPSNLLNHVLGVTRVRVVDYVLASFICMLPGTLAYTYLGYAGREALSGVASLIRPLLFSPHWQRRHICSG
jgi:uncharacterized membrane protein YdjX (TVP38/TMEM64 family)